jgi:hypothetical protein
MAIGAVAVAAVVAIAAYSIGLEQGAAQAAISSGSAAADAYQWGWHRHWGFGFPFGLFFLMWFFLALVRTAFWGPWYRRRWHYYWDDDPRSFDERHRRAHDRMAGGDTAPRQ